MKYLKGRERFLSDIKQLNQQQINEAFDMGGSQGPFGNDIAWGDSLVGRLINWAIRKIGVAVNMVRIQPVINRLKMEFRYLLESSKAAGLDEETRKKISMFIIVQQIRIIKFAIVDMKSPGTDEDVEGGEIQDITEMGFSDIKTENYLKECESIIDGCVEQMSGAVDEYGEIDNFDELMKIMKELQGMIKIMKQEIKEEEGGGSEEEDSKKDETITSMDDYIANFSSVANIVLEYDAIRKAKAEQFKGKTPTSGESKGLTQSAPVEAEKQVMGSKTMDSYSFISEATTGSPIMKPLKSLYDTMKQISPEDLTTDLQSFLKMSDETKKSEKFARPIGNIYKYIRLKSGIKESVRINEDINMILSKDKVIGDALVALYTVSKTKPDGGFPEVTPKLKQALATFNLTMANCLKPKEKEEVPSESKESQAKNEKLVLNYQDFKEEFIVNESKIGEFLGWGAAKIAQLFGYGEEEAKQVKDEDVKKMKVSKDKAQKILSLYWNDLYTNRITKVLITEDEFRKLTEELSKLDEEPGTGEGIIINGIDPIIAILRCFNRAYKLYTVPVIPGGRSKGAVDRATFAEYTSFGSRSYGESLSAYAGPFRHNKTYNMWENAVMDIMQDSEFQSIFDKDTVLQVGDKRKTGAGPILRQFMTDIMDGETLYKSGEDRTTTGGGGAQKQLLDKYFGEVVKVEEVDPKKFAFGSQTELTENEELQGKIKSTTVKFEPGNTRDIKEDDFKGMMFKLKVEMEKPKDFDADTKDDDQKEKNREIETEKRYFFVQEAGGGDFFLVHSISFFEFARYIESDYTAEKRDQKMTVSFDPASLKTERPRNIYLTRMKSSDFRTLLTNGGLLELGGTLVRTTDKKSIGNQKTISVEILNTEEEKGKKKMYKLEHFVPKGDIKHFKDVKSGHASESKKK